MGSLFMKPYKRNHVDKEDYLTSLIFYIHLNPVHHGFTQSFESYRYSSYQSIINKEESPLDLKRDEVISWFGGLEGFRSGHRINRNLYTKKSFIFE